MLFPAAQAKDRPVILKEPQLKGTVGTSRKSLNLVETFDDRFEE